MQPTTPAEVADAVRAMPRLSIRAGGSKTALAPTNGVPILDLSGLGGVSEYDPAEYTFTAFAGTPVSEVAALLEQNGQYLPFDPILAERGATLGGVVAANAGGPGRYRFGGVRDFILGVQFVDGAGDLHYGGGKVVKNAAGFDLPKLFVGSLGRLGVLTELTFKVFPRPARYTTLRVDCGTLASALAILEKLLRAPLDIEALDLTPPGTLWVRLGGLLVALSSRLEQLQTVSGAGEVLDEAADLAVWHAARELTWAPADATVLKVPVTPARIPTLDAALEPHGAVRRYSAGGNIAWVAWPGDLDALDSLLTRLDLNGSPLLGAPARPIVGKPLDPTLLQRVKTTFDPAGRFPEFA